jgi:hypothetical protein
MVMGLQYQCHEGKGDWHRCRVLTIFEPECCDIAEDEDKDEDKDGNEDDPATCGFIRGTLLTRVILGESRTKTGAACAFCYAFVVLST